MSALLQKVKTLAVTMANWNMKHICLDKQKKYLNVW